MRNIDRKKGEVKRALGLSKSMRKLRGRFPLNACSCKGRVKFRVSDGKFYVVCGCGRHTFYPHPTPVGAQMAWNRYTQKQ